ncbi:MAG: cytochrome b/b6 domain-containing protein [Chromatocurvus sp.]
MVSDTKSESAQPVLWDLPVRAIHWLLALCVPAAWWTAEEGYMEQHSWIGYSVLVLVTTRLVWGVVGSPQARFGDFLRGPRAALAYLRGAPPDTPGHNPLGGWSSMALWLVLLSQAGSGLFNSDGILFDGPLYHAADTGVTDFLGSIHELAFNILLGLIALHLAAIAYYQFIARQRLLGPMLRGYAEGRHGTGPARPWWWAVLIAGLLALLLWGVIAAAPEPESYW